MTKQQAAIGDRPHERTLRPRRPVSCRFCRARKLRCTRKVPCSNCVSRGLTCEIEAEPEHAVPHAVRAAAAAAAAAAGSQQDGTPESPSFSSSATSDRERCPDDSSTGAQAQIMDRLQRLEQLVAQSMKPNESTGGSASLGTNTSSPVSTVQPSQSCPLPRPFTEHSVLPMVAQEEPTPDLPTSCLPQVSDDVRWLEKVSMGQPIYSKLASEMPIVFRIGSLRNRPLAPTYIMPSPSPYAKPVCCIWLPEYSEAQALLNEYKSTMYIQHIAFAPTLPGVLDQVYQQLARSEDPVTSHGAGQPPFGRVALLLSVFASAVCTWKFDSDDSDCDIFPVTSTARDRTCYWIEATLSVIQAAQSAGDLSLDLMQGILVLSFLVCNYEGFSPRCRWLMNTAFLLAHEMGLHRTDLPTGQPLQGSEAEVEIRRRVWWYLASTDWFVSQRYSGGPTDGVYIYHPAHMAVRKPRHVNDAELSLEDDSAAWKQHQQVERPSSERTDMSYFLQRIRLAEVCRGITDRRLPLAMVGTCGGFGGPGAVANGEIINTGERYEDILACDANLDNLIQEMPTFLRFETYQTEQPLPPRSEHRAIIQAYLLSTMAETARCRLHLPYLTSKKYSQHTLRKHECSRFQSCYEYMRKSCVEAARRIVQNEIWLEKLLGPRGGEKADPFLRMRVLFTCMLYNLAIASIVLLMDLCVHGDPRSLQCLQDSSPLSSEALRRGEVTEAFRMLESARGTSHIASQLLDSLMSVLSKFRQRKEEAAGREGQGGGGGERRREATPSGPPTGPHKDRMRTGLMFCMPRLVQPDEQEQAQAANRGPAASSTATASTDAAQVPPAELQTISEEWAISAAEASNSTPSGSERRPVADDSLLSCLGDLGQAFEEAGGLGAIQWENFFSDMEMSFI